MEPLLKVLPPPPLRAGWGEGADLFSPCELFIQLPPISDWEVSTPFDLGLPLGPCLPTVEGQGPKGSPLALGQSFPQIPTLTMRPCLTLSISEEAETLDFAQKGGHTMGASEGLGCSLLARLAGGQGAGRVLDTPLAGFPLSQTDLCPSRCDAAPINTPGFAGSKGEEWAGPFPFPSLPQCPPPLPQVTRTLDFLSPGCSVRLSSPPLP